MKKIILFTQKMSLLFLGLFSFPVHANMNSTDCNNKIIQLEATISALKDRIESLENKNSSNADTWICVYNGFAQNRDDGYTGVGATRAIASLRAREQCKKNDVSKGAFCKEAKCYQ